MELGDLHAFKISDLDALKNFISRRDDHFRVPYAEYFIDCRRCLIIIATANREEFLRDEGRASDRFKWDAAIPFGQRQGSPVRAASPPGKRGKLIDLAG